MSFLVSVFVVFILEVVNAFLFQVGLIDVRGFFLRDVAKRRRVIFLIVIFIVLFILLSCIGFSDWVFRLF